MSATSARHHPKVGQGNIRTRFHIFAKGMKHTLSRPSNSLPLDEEVFSLPAATIDRQNSAGRQTPLPAQRKSSGSSAPKAAKQAFLPGLSRRGRPRGKNAVPATTRAKESRRKRIETGDRRIELMLAPDIAASLEALCLHFKESRADVVSRLVAKAAARMFK